MTPLPDCTNTRELLAIGDAAVYPVADVEALRAERDALKAKLDTMAEWAAKVPHAENCNSLCPYCEGLEADYHTACSVGPCSCHLSRIPSDLIARGKDIAEMERDKQRMDWLEANPESNEPRIIFHPPSDSISWRINSEDGEFATLREAIDAAMKGEGR